MKSDKGRILGVYILWAIASVVLMIQNPLLEGIRKILRLICIAHFAVLVYISIGALLISLSIRKGKLDFRPIYFLLTVVVLSYGLYRLLYKVGMLGFWGL